MSGALLPIFPSILLTFQGTILRIEEMPLEKSVLVPLHQRVWRQGWEVAIGCIGRGYRWV